MFHHMINNTVQNPYGIKRITKFSFKGCKIELNNNTKQNILWSSLSRCWGYWDQIEDAGYSLNSRFLTVCFTIFGGKRGIVATWDTIKQAWVHIQDGKYVISAILLAGRGIIISLRYTPDRLTFGQYQLYASRFKRTIDANEENSILVKTIWTQRCFDKTVEKYCCEALVYLESGHGLERELERKYGPGGLFYNDQEETIVAYYAGYFSETSLELFLI